MFDSCNKRFLLTFFMMALIECCKTNSVVNDVSAHNNELKPPTLLNFTTIANQTTTNKKVQVVRHEFGISNVTGRRGLHWHSFPSNNNSY